MNPDFDALLALDAADRRIAAADEETAALAAESRRRLAAVAKARTTIAEFEGAVLANEAAVHAVTVGIRTHADRRASAVRALEEGLGDAAAAERQIAAARAAIATAEDQALILLEAGEALAAQLEAARRALPACESLRADFEADAPSATEAIAARRAAATQAAATARAALPKELLVRYDLLRRKGFAVTKVAAHACSSCKAHIQAQHLADLKKGQLDPCRGCGRFLAP